jgi:D-amino-acid dehydrogenase
MTRQAVIVGAGIVGLSVAWFLQEEGFAVTVFDRTGVAAGASAGNAGWLTPAMIAPLPEPSVLRYGLASLPRRDSPLRIPPADLPVTWRFLAAFAAHCTTRRWLAGVSRFAPISALALPAYDRLAEAGLGGLTEAPVLAAFHRPEKARPMLHELGEIARIGAGADVDELGDSELHDQVPQLSARARFGLRIHRQRYLQPLDYVRNLATAVCARGAALETGSPVTAVRPGPGGRLRVETAHRTDDFDLCVLATGAWISRLARPAGVRVQVAAGRGYSVTVPSPEPLAVPVYLPELRVACAPSPDGIRFVGTMEFRPADAPLDQRRIASILRSARLFIPGVRWQEATSPWVGPRPMTADGLPLIGATRVAGLYVAGGHGMWGMTLGPATGQLLAELITTGRTPPALRPFDPCR